MERKVKYSYEFKLRCVDFVVKKHYSCGTVSKLEGPNDLKSIFLKHNPNKKTLKQLLFKGLFW
jgi:hypothetical protein